MEGVGPVGLLADAETLMGYSAAAGASRQIVIGAAVVNLVPSLPLLNLVPSLRRGRDVLRKTVTNLRCSRLPDEAVLIVKVLLVDRWTTSKSFRIACG
jgi:hypothetical protein